MDWVELVNSPGCIDGRLRSRRVMQGGKNEHAENVEIWVENVENNGNYGNYGNHGNNGKKGRKYYFILRIQCVRDANCIESLRLYGEL